MGVRPIVLMVAVLAAAMCRDLQPADAAEIRLRSDCACMSAVVTLGDVADVFAADADEAARLAAVELFLAPPAGERRFLEAREIQDLLLIRGISLVEHRFSGAARVTVSRRPPDAPASAASPLPDGAIGRAEDRVRRAVLHYLAENASGAEPWEVEVALQEEEARVVNGTDGDLTVRGGSPPWTGTQRFEVAVDRPGEAAAFAVEAEVTLPASVVVAAKAIPRGTIVRTGDVRLERVAANDLPREACRDLAEVVGLEMTRSVPAGKAIEPGHVRPPVFVRRGDVIAVSARSTGIRVTTTARAKEDGSLGDVVAVESVEGRRLYYAQVTGVQEAEVCVAPSRVEWTAQR